MVGAVGIELKATLKTRKLLILLNGKNAKNTGFAQLRYTPGTRLRGFYHAPLWGFWRAAGPYVPSSASTSRLSSG
jgi:hypothetical protein